MRACLYRGFSRRRGRARHHTALENLATIETMTSLPLPLAAFVAGLISFLSPCVLPLVPGYVSLISGVGVEQLKMKEGQLFRKVMLNSAAFIIGFSIVFITLGAISTEVGQVLAQYKSLLARIAGAVIILFGLHLTGMFADQGSARRHAAAQPQRQFFRLGSIRHRLRVRLRMDPLRRPHSRGRARIRRRAGHRLERHLSAGHLLGRTGRAFPADFARHRALS
jgi:cytochrome c biogenesis protein CcdA